MSYYEEGEHTEQYDQQIGQAMDLLICLEQHPEFSSIGALIHNYAIYSGTAPVKLVAAYSDNELIHLGSQVTHKDLLSYITQDMKEESGDGGPTFRQRISALYTLFIFIQDRIDYLDPVFSQFINRINNLKCFYTDRVPSLGPGIRERFCKPLSGALMQHIWDNLYFGLPDFRAKLSYQEYLRVSKSHFERRAIVIEFIPQILGRFIDAYLSIFVECYFDNDRSGCSDLDDVCCEENIFSDAMTRGFQAIESLD
jgi:hypothetical protein